MINLSKAFVYKKRLQKFIDSEIFCLRNLNVVHEKNTPTVSFNYDTEHSKILEAQEALTALSYVIAQVNSWRASQEKSGTELISEINNLKALKQIYSYQINNVQEFQAEKQVFDPNALDTSVNPPVRGKYVVKEYEKLSKIDFYEKLKETEEKIIELEDELAEFNNSNYIDAALEQLKVGDKNALEFIKNFKC